MSKSKRREPTRKQKKERELQDRRREERFRRGDSLRNSNPDNRSTSKQELREYWSRPHKK